MGEITQSGFQQDELGLPIIVTQGSSGYTLVDKKKILFRVFAHPYQLSRVNQVFVRIKYAGPGNIPDANILIPFDDLLIENSAPNGPSVGIVLQGDLFPNASLRYFVHIFLQDAYGLSAGRSPFYLRFKKSGRLRVLVKAAYGTAPWGNKIEQDLGWFVDILTSLFRFSAMLPVSDGFIIDLLKPNNKPEIGFAWTAGEPFDTWPNPCPSGNPPSEPDPDFPNVLRCPGSEMNNFLIEEAKQFRSQGFRIDATVTWRPRDAAKFPPPGGEDSGGQSPFGINTAPANRLATVCGGFWRGVYTTAPIIAQEVGHTFGLEPKESPHYDGRGHSKDFEIDDVFAFDFVNLKPYYPFPQGPLGQFLGDVMGSGWMQGRDLTLYNAYDWEYLRQRLVEVSALASEDLDESEKQKKLVEEIQNPFTKLQKIQVEDPTSALSSKPGFEWHWTRNGFQRLVEGKPRPQRLAPSAELILSGMRELDVKEFYAPIDGKPLPIVVKTTAAMTCYTDGIRSSGLP